MSTGTPGYRTQDGILRTPEQIEAAFRACWLLEKAYMKASEDQGGGSSVDWDDVDEASEVAVQALADVEIADITALARAFNGEEPEPALAPVLVEPAWPFERKRTDDTEGGTPD